MKSVKILSLAFGLILLVSAASFAQTSMTTTYATIAVAPNAQTGLVGEVDFVPLVTGTIPVGESITITYSAPISAITDMQIYVLGCNSNNPITSTSFGTPVACTAGNVTVSTTAPGSAILLSFAGAPVATPISQQFVRITGVRVNVAATSAAINTVVNATVTNSVGVGTITNNFVPVAQVTEVIAFTATSYTFPQVAQTGGTSSGNVIITELFANAFETKGATNPTQLALTVAPPSGFTFVTTGYTSGQVLTTSTPSFDARLVSASATGLTINIYSQNPQLLDTITVPMSFSAVGPVPLTPGTAAITATLAPPLSATAVLPIAVGTQAGQSPIRYAARTVNTAISFAVGQAMTLLYTPFSAWVPGFNTGFAIGNPTGVNRIAAVGLTPATPFFAAAQPGTVKAWLVPADGTTPLVIQTSATVKPGLGLDTAGQIPAGGEWSVLLSDLGAAAGVTSFQGQVFFQTNFSDAHGVSFIADPSFSVMAQGYPLLVLYGTGLNN